MVMCNLRYWVYIVGASLMYLKEASLAQSLIWDKIRHLGSI